MTTNPRWPPGLFPPYRLSVSFLAKDGSHENANDAGLGDAVWRVGEASRSRPESALGRSHCDYRIEIEIYPVVVVDP